MRFETYNHLLAKILGESLFTQNFPYEVRIETINACNSTCAFCPMNIYSEETKNRTTVRMNEVLFEKILKELQKKKWLLMIK